MTKKELYVSPTTEIEPFFFEGPLCTSTQSIDDYTVLDGTGIIWD